MIPFIVTQFVGVKYVAIEPSIPEEDLSYLFEYLQMKIIFVSERFEKKIEKYLSSPSFKGEVIVLGKSQKFTDLSQILQISEGIETFQPIHIADIKEDAVIFLSSGTTGKPKEYVSAIMPF
ncbi:hypothetical protein WA026_020105 [Henosepilachna vigintioctopunctata]|uniref:AMP-dependent synthetase/ligase domain-containing protein n=1 Tax=Henosepilachna vigintioctopunctata TaxID=420089 RepID=A0AAW1U4L4_9CUCU